MKLLLDNIVFSLQTSGGISVLWEELIVKLQEQQLDTYYLEYENSNKNIFRNRIQIPERQIVHKGKLGLMRYLNPKIDIDKKFIFHSSYYRTCNSKNAINITTVHDFTYEYFFKGVRKSIHSFQKNNAIRNSDLVICISENTKRDLERFVPGVDAGKIKVVYNGVSDDYFKIIEPFDIVAELPQMHKAKDKKIILFVGHRGGYKNFDKVVSAFSKLDPKSFHLVTVGNPLTDDERILLNKEISAENYTELSHLDNAHLNMVYNISFALVYPSEYEGFGIPAVEAMKAGLPVVALNASSLSEILEGVETLIKTSAPEEIIQMLHKLENPEFKAEAISKGFDLSAKFTWDTTTENYLKLYQEVYEKSK